MHAPRTRREFLTTVGQGTLIATLGSVLARDLGLGRVMAGEPTEPLSFGQLDPLVALMQETPIEKLMPTLVEQLRAGTTLQSLLTAGALANARTFGGEDYVGFHTMMALSPAFHMAQESPEPRRALPVFKVLYRNTNRIQEHGGRTGEVLQTVHAPESAGGPVGEELRAAVRAKDLAKAEQIFATGNAGRTPEEAFNDLLYAVEDGTDVHRVVLPYRAYDLLGLIGREHAHTMLRQSVHYCVMNENNTQSTRRDAPRNLLPKLLEQYHLLGREPGTRTADDAWVESMSQTLATSSPEAAAEAVAAALAEGFVPDAVGEAMSLAANQLVLRDAGRLPREEWPGKPVGSVHGDSIGVHACDSANAWRNMARVGTPRNVFACLILGAYQVALDRDGRGPNNGHWDTLPVPYQLDRHKTTDKAELLAELDEAIRANLQARAVTITFHYGQQGHDPRAVFDVLLKYGTSEDGALHAEKYYRTVSEEFATTRPAFRWRQLTALARVTASEYGRPAPGYAEACGLLKV